jgi:hypothetical protein
VTKITGAGDGFRIPNRGRPFGPPLHVNGIKRIRNGTLSNRPGELLGKIHVPSCKGWVPARGLKALACLGSSIQAEVTLHAAVPGFIVAGVQIYPLLISHLSTPLQEGSSVGSDWMPELPGPTLGDF